VIGLRRSSFMWRVGGNESSPAGDQPLAWLFAPAHDGSAELELSRTRAMLLCIPEILTATEARQVRDRVLSLRFVDGSVTAGAYARTVKRNEQLESGPEVQKLQEFVMQALMRSVEFERFARPRNMKPILFSRYQPGMEYGTHVDNAVMSGRPLVRSDVSLTLFLSDPDSYDGGELAIGTMTGEEQIKLPAGSIVAYPSSTLHRVVPVSRGTRVAAVTWVQSTIRDPACREILYDLETTRQAIFQNQGKTREFDLVSKSFANLMRMWAEL
jgi:PKHD-type hydroxylase